MINTRYLIRDEAVEFLTHEINVERNLRTHPLLFVICLLRLLSMPLKDPIFYFKNTPISIIELLPHLIMKQDKGRKTELSF